MKKKKYTQAEEFAIQQFTGMHYSEGIHVVNVCRGMGLSRDEWYKIKDDCDWLSKYELREIKDYLKELL